MKLVKLMFNYVLKNNNRTVYIGITDDPGQAVRRHRKAGLTFNRMRLIGRAKTEEKARELQGIMLDHYQRHHKGEAPRYNGDDAPGPHSVEAA